MEISAPTLSQLRELEAESVHIMREVAAELERPVLLFSGGKDSIVLLRLAEKAFRPGRSRSRSCTWTPATTSRRCSSSATGGRRARRDEIVASVQERSTRVAPSSRGCPQPAADRHAARRDRRAPVRRRVRRRPPRRGARTGEGADLLVPRRPRPVGAARPAPGAVEPLQRRDQPGETVRVFPLSNWTELDVWRYIGEEELELPSIYFAHEREVFERDGMLYAVSEWLRRSTARPRRRRCATARWATWPNESPQAGGSKTSFTRPAETIIKIETATTRFAGSDHTGRNCCHN